MRLHERISSRASVVARCSHRVARCALIAATAISCGEATAPAIRPVPAALVVVSGGDQAGVVGSELSNALVVRIVDADGAPVGGQLVNFRVTAGGGSAFAGSALTNADGIARERWTLGTSTSEVQTMEVRAVNDSTGAALVFGVFHATPQTAAPDSVRIVSGNSQSAPVATLLSDSLLVRVTDRYGNGVPGVTVSWAVSPGGGTLNRATDVTTTTGHASTKLTGGTHSGSTAVTATLATRMATFSAQIVATTPATITVYQGADQHAVAGDVIFPVAPAFRVLDVYGNPVPGALVRFTSSGGSVSANSTGPGTPVPTSDSGIVRVFLGVSTRAGTDSLIASVTGLPPAILTAKVTGAVAYVMEPLSDLFAERLPLGPAVTQRITLRLRDRYQNLSGPSTVAFAVVDGEGVVSAAQVLSDSLGLAIVDWGLRTKGLHSMTAILRPPGLPPQTVLFKRSVGDWTEGLSVQIWDDDIINIGVVGDTVQAKVYITDRPDVVSVKMGPLGGTQTELTRPSTSKLPWTGAVSLVGASRGIIQLIATAQITSGEKSDGFMIVNHDRRPTIVVSPAEGSTVNGSTVHITAYCVDDDPRDCFVRLSRAAPWLTAIDQTITGVTPGPKSFPVWALDSRGQETQVIVHYTVVP